MLAFSTQVELPILLGNVVVLLISIGVIAAFRPQIRWSHDRRAYVFPRGRWNPGFELTGPDEARRLAFRMQAYFTFPVVALVLGELIDGQHDLPPILTLLLVLVAVAAGRAWTARDLERVIRETDTSAAGGNMSRASAHAGPGR